MVRGEKIVIIKYDTVRLKKLIEDIFDLTGISVSVLDNKYNLLTNCSHKNDFCSFLQTFPEEKRHCRNCDIKLLNLCKKSKKLENHICRTGLYDSAMPIIKYNTAVGYVILGRVRSEEYDKELKYFPDTNPLTKEKLIKHYDNIPILSKKQLDAIYDILPYILFNNAIKIVYDPFAEEIIEYINNHLKDKLSIDLLCVKFNISSTFLYKIFEKNLGVTVNEYIIEQRLNLAKELLINKNLPIYAIAEEVGINNYTYFCKIFKKRTGYSPNNYRNTLAK